MTTLDEHGGWPQVLGRLSEGSDLDSSACKAVLGTILAGHVSDAQIAAFIVALRQKGETVDEMAGLVRAMWAAAVPLDLPDGAIDIVGVGGAPRRREAALNVSTMAAVVAAGAGAVVCKHGNRRASSTSGSFDLLEALGVHIDLEAEALERCVRETGLGFAFARTFHPAMRHVGPVRAELGIPTVFNMLGPLSHPGHVVRQVIGVADESVADRMLAVLAANGSRHSMVVTGDGPIDEISVTGPTSIHELIDGEVSTHRIDPASLGLEVRDPAELPGGDAEANAEIARRMLAGEPGPERDIVALNAAAGLIVAGLADDLQGGLERAFAAIDNGAAAASLARLVDVSNRP